MSLSEVYGMASSAMQANRLWIDVIANNVANANTTRTATGDPFRRQIPIFEQLMDKELAMQSTSFPGDGGESGEVPLNYGKGVQATAIVGDQAPFKVIFNPGHPDADAKGFVRMPNISIITEMVDMLAAQRNYDASVQLTNAAKTMGQKALEIGR
ncbi:MAG: flagellar basal body rod protein FlgC [Candidatus Sericytochromatia bacterium]|nr:flagellar basal body rod protein FlgC [Candidatus Sericytochromatia bacterium]